MGLSPQLVNPSSSIASTFRRQTLPDFMAREFPPKRPLIEGVLYARDRISLTGRRRQGKTTFLANIALAGALGHSEYLGFPIPNPFSTLAFYLEDDGGEMQFKLKKMFGAPPSGVDLYMREDLEELRIPISVDEENFRQFVFEAAEVAKPDLIIFDNLGHLIGADYNNSKRVHQLMEFTFKLGREFDSAVLIAAHPRKGSGLNGPTGKPTAVSLVENPQLFFEEAMGSSHFINSTGSLWGIERDYQNGRSNLLLGTQRLTGTETITSVEKNDDDWFQRVDDIAISCERLRNTEQRKKAWDLLPADRDFKQSEAQELTRSVMKSNGSFIPWWSELRRQGLIKEVSHGSFRKEKSCGKTN